VVNPRASLLADPTRRERVVGEGRSRVERRYGREPRIETGSIEAADAAMAESIEAPVIVVVGGDGTVRQAAETLVGAPTPLAIVPGGTGQRARGHARHPWHRPRDRGDRGGETRSLDLGRARWWPARGGRVSRPRARHTRTSGRSSSLRDGSRRPDHGRRGARVEARMRFGAYVGAALASSSLESATFRIVADGDAVRRGRLPGPGRERRRPRPGRIGPRRRIDPTTAGST
jgi:hypothetical protein